MASAPNGSGFRFLRKSAGLSQAAVAARIGVTQPLVARWEKCLNTPSAEAWAELERPLTLGKRQKREVPKYLLAADLGGGHFKFLPSEGLELAVWTDPDVAYDSAMALRAMTGGYVNAYALPAWADYVTALLLEFDGAWYAADERGIPGVTEWFGVRARCLDHLASVVRQAAVGAATLAVKEPVA